MGNGSLKQSLKMILVVCLVCSLLVSAAAVMLNARQNENQRQNRIKNILIAAGLFRDDADNGAIYQRHIEPVLIELHSGNQVNEASIGPNFTIGNFDIDRLASDPVLGVAIADADDLAKIKRRPRFMVVYIVKTGGRAVKLILPVYGKGLWSTIYGLLALDRDLHTISGITFYQHGETPGLGGEIENPRWQQLWQGKQIFDKGGRTIIKVLRGEADAASPDANHQIDGLAGATMTSRGIQQLLHYWLGEQGYGPLLKRLQQEWPEPTLQQTG
jgi:Na+-transporting NADH:ubiquinone oxidoreductase subunit C